MASLVATAAHACLALVVSLSHFDVGGPTIGASETPALLAAFEQGHHPAAGARHHSSPVNVTSVACSAVRLQNATVDFSTTRVGFAADAAFVNCTAGLSVTTGAAQAPAVGHIDMVLRAPRLQAWVALDTPQGSCLAANATVAACDCDLDVEELTAVFPGHWGTTIVVDIALSAVRAKLNANGSTMFCGVVGPGLVRAVLDHAVPPPTPIPAVAPWASDLRTAALPAALVAVVESLPALGALRLGATFAGSDGQAVVIDATAASVVNITHGGSTSSSSSSAQHHHHQSTLASSPSSSSPQGANREANGSSPALSLVIPEGAGLSITIAVNATCSRTDERAGCLVPAGQTAVLNVRAVHAGESDHFIDTVVGRLVEDVLDSLLDRNSDAGANASDLGIALAGASAEPAAWVPALLFLLTVAITAAAGFATHRRFRGRSLQHLQTRRVITLKEKVLTDTAIVFFAVAFLCVALLDVFGCAVQTRMGGLPVHRLLVPDAIKTNWDNGVYPSAVVTALFVVAFPVVRSLLIVIVAVVLQRPSSRVLQVLDLCGKLMLVNKYASAMSSDAMTVPAILTMHLGLSGPLGAVTFFTLVFGCCVSYAPTAVDAGECDAGDSAHLNALLVEEEGIHSASTEARHCTDDLPIDDSALATVSGSTALTCRRRCVNSVFGTPGDVPCRIEALRVPNDQGRPWDAPWRPFVGVPLLAIFSIAIASALLSPTIMIHRTGFMTLLLGETTGYSVVDMFRTLSPEMAVELYVATCIAPLQFALEYARGRFVASICALDTFVLAGVTGLLQLERMVEGALGSGSSAMLSVRASFEWPFLLIVVAAAAQVVAIVVMACHRQLTPTS